MMELDDQQKFQVLMMAVQERYNASHRIRDRSTQFALWISGMAIGLSWLLIGHTALTLFQRVSLTLLIATLFAGAAYFILGLMRGFRKNREAMIRCESALGMHDRGFVLKDGPLLPADYGAISHKWSDHFCTLCVWMILVALSLLILAWTDPAFPAGFWA